MRIITLALVFSALALTGCSKPKQDLKSPCVGIEGSPCGDRYPVNEHWLKELKAKA